MTKFYVDGATSFIAVGTVNERLAPCTYQENVGGDIRKSAHLQVLQVDIVLLMIKRVEKQNQAFANHITEGARQM